MATDHLSAPEKDERVWLITGASSGFGRAVAEAALAAGDTVVATARRPETLRGLATGYPDHLVPLALDVTDHQRITDVVAEAVRRCGRIDVLVNNAGRGHIGAVEEAADGELREMMELHFFGPAALVRAVLPHMRSRSSGAIVQMSSMGGRFSFAGVGAYSASKFALEGLSEALAHEVAPHGIQVLIVEPGAFRTAFAGNDVLLRSTPLPAYQDTVGPLRTSLPSTDGRQPGDPDKAAAAILAALAADKPPLRLPLGNDAADGVLAHLDSARAEAVAWASVSRGMDVDS
ncbi:oxidoreductase [Marinitenerispora sediminis]|uniref:Short-chain dehydrogenase/reductase n=1 Tax=Marinitenerispora sediminis TaxID=1931232 RepID=A0A368T293_9ACTN|nr:oxidoreductase [Marinitenerispora sediminis]RCV49038.1 short-chain dehydrogenase/reductase [Marinitenerispora sediminis]RCV51800.1 short-chain dehydrogenase/reductase [Marinitenerispora sediminis]RCV55418.1 short-chain dehydrogenase/reductase [Marinitenerispora sediminis]